MPLPKWLLEKSLYSFILWLKWEFLGIVTRLLDWGDFEKYFDTKSEDLLKTLLKWYGNLTGSPGYDYFVLQWKF